MTNNQKEKLTITIKDWKNLQALHAGIYVLNYKYNLEKEVNQIKSCLKMNFEELDKNNIPFRLQNLVIMLAEQKRPIKDIKEYYNLTIKYSNNSKQVIG